MGRSVLILFACAVLLIGRQAQAQPSLKTPAFVEASELPPVGFGKSADEVVLRVQKAMKETKVEQEMAQGAAQDGKLKQQVELLQKQIAILQKMIEIQSAEQYAKLKQQVELLQKQIVVQQKMIQALADNRAKQPAAGMEKLETQIATLEARSKQAAQRDVELAQGVDKLTEERDADQRFGPKLPAGLKELFLPSGNNETTLSIYGALAFGYSSFQGNAATAANGAGRPSVPGGFYFGEFTPDFFVKLNDWILLEAEIGVGGNGSVSAGSFAQADFIVNDWLTIIGGRFVAPIGWYNERLNNPWVNKLPGDAPGSGPLLWQQVLPPMSLLGVQATGAFYLGNSPFKMEYAAYVSNGLNALPATPGAPTIDELANLENMVGNGTFIPSQNNKATGGRLGLWWPEIGLEAGFSGMFNSDYIAGFGDHMSLLAVDLNYHKDNWDVRLEYGQMFQQTADFGFNNIVRRGFNGQIAYRPRDLPNGFLQKMEFVYRYGYVDFSGIDPTTLNLGSYATPVDVPIRRQQNEFGINYWFAPRLVIKFAYQINDEPGFHLHDNQLLTELAWGW
jgi:hypothetical protein